MSDSRRSRRDLFTGWFDAFRGATSAAAGASSATTVAARMNMPADVIERAKALLDREDRQLDRMLSELAESRARAEAAGITLREAPLEPARRGLDRLRRERAPDPLLESLLHRRARRL